MMPDDLRELLHAFNDHGVKYLIVGGYAFGVHAEPRATKALDIFIRSDQENSKAVFRALAQYGAPFLPETAALRAGRTMLADIRSFARRRVSFAFETTLSGRSYLTLLRKFRAEGMTFTSSFYGLRAWILRCQESKSEFQEADTMSLNPFSDDVSIALCKISSFTIGLWPRVGHYLTTRVQSPVSLRPREMKRSV